MPTKIVGWSEEELETFKDWYKKKSVQILRQEGMERSLALARLKQELDNYVKIKWGRKTRLMKEKTNLKRVKERKRRYDRLKVKNLEFWNSREDAKEHRIIRELTRRDDISRGEPYSFQEYIRRLRIIRKKPFTITSEEEFKKLLDEDIEKNYRIGPKSAHKHRNVNESYTTRRQIEVEDPIIFEIRRKARVAQLVEERENAIKERVDLIKLSEYRSRKNEIDIQNYNTRMGHWNNVFNEWMDRHKKINELRAEYHKKRLEVISLARQEYLRAIDEDVSKWVYTPDECRFMRFKFKPGVVFPYNLAEKENKEEENKEKTNEKIEKKVSQ